MKNLKVVLPMMAFIFAIGLTFATVDSEPKPEIPDNESYALMYVNIDGNWEKIEVDCGIGSEDCLVVFADAPSEGNFQVYYSDDFESPVEDGAGGIKATQTPFPNNR